MGDARYDYSGFILRWFDHWLKGVDNGVTKEPKVRVYTMGANQWRTFDTWPPPEARPVRYYLDSDGGANTRSGNGRLTIGRPAKSGEDKFAYDPLHPTPSAGGQVCCFAAAPGGSFDQSEVESRPDVLVYTSDLLKSPVEVTGSIPVSVYLSSDVKQDLMVTLVDVYPNGRAFNLDGQALRVRWREGYDHPAFMEPNHVYKVDLPPLVTSNAFLTGHRIRLAIASSGFPQLQRNLNTGGNNYDERNAVTAHNVIHHGPAYLSSIVLRSSPPRWPRADLETRRVAMRRAQPALLIGLIGSVAFPPLASAQVAATSTPAATRPSRGPDPAVVEYFATQVDKEEMVRIPMRDGVRLNGTLFFAKNQPRTKLPTVLVFFPYQINGVSAENEQLLQHGYAIAYVNARGRYYSEGRYTFLTGSATTATTRSTGLRRSPGPTARSGRSDTRRVRKNKRKE